MASWLKPRHAGHHGAARRERRRQTGRIDFGRGSRRRVRVGGRLDRRRLLSLPLMLVAMGTLIAAFAADTPNGVAGGFCVAVVVLASARHLGAAPTPLRKLACDPPELP